VLVRADPNPKRHLLHNERDAISKGHLAKHNVYFTEPNENEINVLDEQMSTPYHTMFGVYSMTKLLK